MSNEIKTFDCQISRRGKGAKGTITVQTFGEPIVDDNGVAKDWKYSDVAKLYKTEDILARLSLMGDLNQILLMAGDEINKSQTAQAEQLIQVLVARLQAEKLVGKDEPEDIAKTMIQVRKNADEIGMTVPTFDELFIARKNKLEKAPRLVKK